MKAINTIAALVCLITVVTMATLGWGKGLSLSGLVFTLYTAVMGVGLALLVLTEVRQDRKDRALAALNTLDFEIQQRENSRAGARRVTNGLGLDATEQATLEALFQAPEAMTARELTEAKNWLEFCLHLEA